jgi:hypothetical protein
LPEAIGRALLFNTAVYLKQVCPGMPVFYFKTLIPALSLTGRGD